MRNTMDQYCWLAASSADTAPSLGRRWTAQRLAGVSTHAPARAGAGAADAPDDVHSKVRTQLLVLARINNLDDIVGAFGAGVVDGLTPALANRIARLYELTQLQVDPAAGKVALLLQTAGRAPASVVEGIKQAIAHALPVADTVVYVDVSLGVVPVGPLWDPDDVLQRAHAALSAALRRGAFAEIYPDGEVDRQRERLALLAEFATAVDSNELSVHYQPQVRLSDGATVGLEALVRWRHPTRGLLMPGAFLQEVEKTALVHALARCVADRVLRDIAGWRRGGQALTCAINLSARDLQDPSLMDYIRHRAAALDIPGSWLEFEITETEIIHQSPQLLTAIRAMKDMGCKISIDDFGTGYTSLAHLTTLPVDRIKIDQALIRALPTCGRTGAVVAAIVQMADSLRLGVVAEGVESEEVAAAVARLGIDVAQGYHFAPALERRRLSGYLRRTADR